MKPLIAMLALLLSTAASAEDVKCTNCKTPNTSGGAWIVNGNTVTTTLTPRKDWRLVTRHANGKIVVVDRYTTEKECDVARDEQENIPVTDEEKAYAWYFWSKDANAGVTSRTYVKSGDDVLDAACLDW